eukprot:m.367016 g.367016  ORF g.367016 m.367016 type:complete len:248 (+) comp16661_c1_seq8:1826-2569(+)
MPADVGGVSLASSTTLARTEHTAVMTAIGAEVPDFVTAQVPIISPAVSAVVAATNSCSRDSDSAGPIVWFGQPDTQYNRAVYDEWRKPGPGPSTSEVDFRKAKGVLVACSELNEHRTLASLGPFEEESSHRKVKPDHVLRQVIQKGLEREREARRAGKTCLNGSAEAAVSLLTQRFKTAGATEPARVRTLNVALGSTGLPAMFARGILTHACMHIAMKGASPRRCISVVFLTLLNPSSHTISHGRGK